MQRLTIFIILCACVTFIPVATMQEPVQPREEFSTAKVIGILSEKENDDYGIKQTTQNLQVKIVSGPEKGKEVNLENGVMNGRDDMRLKVGETIVLDKTSKSDGTVLYLIKEKYRLPALIWLTVLFIGLTILLGGITGLTSLIGLGASILVLGYYILPSIVRGDDPLTTCVIGAAIIACTSLYLAHGFTKRTSVALLSTIVTLGIATKLATLSVTLGKLFGMGSEESVYLQSGVLANIDLRGLLLGGIIIGCLGVLDDVTTAQCAAIDEISKANPKMYAVALRKAGFSVGREHIASLINTLALAYVGASLPLLLLFQTQDTYPLWVTLNGEFLAEEIIRTLVGSATLVIAVPVSTYFAARLLKADPIKNSPDSLSKSMHRHIH